MEQAVHSGFARMVKKPFRGEKTSPWFVARYLL
jgi:hypothetical protein